jgi:hypothetical protein
MLWKRSSARAMVATELALSYLQYYMQRYWAFLWLAGTTGANWAIEITITIYASE